MYRLKPILTKKTNKLASILLGPQCHQESAILKFSFTEYPKLTILPFYRVSRRLTVVQSSALAAGINPLYIDLSILHMLVLIFEQQTTNAFHLLNIFKKHISQTLINVTSGTHFFSCFHPPIVTICLLITLFIIFDFPL